MIKAGGAITIHLEGDRENRPSKKCENQSIMSISPPPPPPRRVSLFTSQVPLLIFHSASHPPLPLFLTSLTASLSSFMSPGLFATSLFPPSSVTVTPASSHTGTFTPRRCFPSVFHPTEETIDPVLHLLRLLSSFVEFIMYVQDITGHVHPLCLLIYRRTLVPAH